MRCKDCYPEQLCLCGKSLNRCKTTYHSSLWSYEVIYVNGIIIYQCEVCYLKNEKMKKNTSTK